MLLTDLNGPRSLQPRRTGCRGILRFSRATGSLLLVFSSATIFSSALRAQNVAEAARQERGRKQEQQKKAKHVYTAEDLKRQHILTPEDQAAVEAKKNECAQKNNCAPPQNSQPVLDANSQQQAPAVDANSQQQTADANSKQPSLGEIARQYRQQKELRARSQKELQAQKEVQERKQKELEALKPKQSAPFHLPIGTPALASPIQPERPAMRPLAQPIPPRRMAMQPAAAPAILPSAKSVLGSDSPKNVFRRDPFARVQTGPRVPLGAASEVRPAIHPPARVVLPNAPRIPSASVTGKLLPQTAQPKQPAPVSPTPQAASSSVTPLTTPRTTPLTAPTPNTAVVAKSARTISTVALPNIFPPIRPVAPLDSRLTRPAVPTGFDAVKPLAPAPKTQPAVSAAALPPPVFSMKPLSVTPLSPLPPSLEAPLAPMPPLPVATIGPARAAEVSTIKTIRVERGDSLWKLAKEHLGHGSLWPQILAVNPSVTKPGQLRAGSRISLPEVVPTGASRRNKPRSTMQIIIVGRGDTLWSLAKLRLGRSSYWPCLAAANPELGDPNRIFPGQELRLPAGCGVDQGGSKFPALR